MSEEIKQELSISNIEVKIEDMFDHNFHFGHKKGYRSRSMAPYIYKTTNSNFDIINLAATKSMLHKALDFVRHYSKTRKKILFVGTQPQSSSCVQNAATACGQHFISKRWLGGTLTNWSTVSSSIKEMKRLRKILSEEKSPYTKKEILLMRKKYNYLYDIFVGIESLERPPHLMIITSFKEKTALQEAQIKGIPYILLADTNCDDVKAKFIIPINDDSQGAIRLCLDYFAQSCLLGLQDEILKITNTEKKLQTTEKKQILQGWKV